MSDVVPDVGRHAVLVDAGYLYASVGQLVLGRTSRREFRVATEPLIGALLARADRTIRGELLRMYWYDAARDRVPTVEQRQIAALPNVKVRLGHLNSAGQQKGVDAQLRQDLELLARHRAVSDVVLIAGDEDMVPAVEAAQAYGVRVHVWGVEPPYGVNQAERLVWEADTVGQLDVEFCRPYVEVEAAAVEETVEPEPREDKPAVPTPADVFAARKLQAPMPKPVAAAPVPSDRPGPERPEMEQIGARIAARWLLTRGRENVADLLPGPVLPTVIDKELLVEAEEEISRSLRPYEEARRALRDGFWARLHREFGIQLASVPPHPTPDHHQPATPPSGHPDGPGPAQPPAAHSNAAASAHSGPAAQAQSGQAYSGVPAPGQSGPAAPAQSGQVAQAYSGVPASGQSGPAAPTQSGPAAQAYSGTPAPGQSAPAAPGQARPPAPAQSGPAAQAHSGPAAPADSGQAAAAPSGSAAPVDTGPVGPALPGLAASPQSGPADPAHSGPADPAHPGPAAPLRSGPAATTQFAAVDQVPGLPASPAAAGAARPKPAAAGQPAHPAGGSNPAANGPAHAPAGTASTADAPVPHRDASSTPART